MTACASDGKTQDTAANVSKDTTVAAVEDTGDGSYFDKRLDIDDGLDEYNNAFEGKKYRVSVSENDDIYVDVDEDQISEQVDKAVYERNLAAEDVFDIAVQHVVSLGEIATSDLLLNWYNVPNVDFDKPWWSDSTVNELTYNDVCMIAIGDFALTALSNAYCMFYNKEDALVYQMPDLYSVVYEGKWTIDYLLSLTKDIYEDLNRNGQVDDEDYFGFVSDVKSNMNAYMWAFDNPILEVSKDFIDLVVHTEKLADIVTKIIGSVQLGNIRANVNYVNRDGQLQLHYGTEMFARGQALFTNGFISETLTHLRDMTDAYGILPYPKWDESQDDYYTMSDGSHTALAIPVTVPEDNLEFVGAITEALCAETYKTLMPTYYEVALKLKGTRDDESMEMIDFITSRIVYDMGYVYLKPSGCGFLMQDLVMSNNPNFESYWAGIESSVTKHYKDVEAYFINYSS